MEIIKSTPLYEDKRKLVSQLSIKSYETPEAAEQYFRNQIQHITEERKKIGISNLDHEETLDRCTEGTITFQKVQTAARTLGRDVTELVPFDTKRPEADYKRVYHQIAMQDEDTTLLSRITDGKAPHLGHRHPRERAGVVYARYIFPQEKDAQ
ncbi:MAG TPA: hypothetical protein VJK51_01365 [Candidatus Nanoarchaeia archaeon]|nr:hypothetical protein [Candidatus Nanoarchaeia archaeon]